MEKICLNIRRLMLVIGVAMISLVAGYTTLYGDDFIYAGYFMDGISEFLKLSKQHYMQMNGRAFVHFLLEIILIFKDNLFFAVIPAMLVGAFCLARKSFDEKYELLYLILCISGIMCLPSAILREGVYWMAGAMNYIYPTLIFFASFYIFDKSVNKEKVNAGGVIVSFLAGASTEQCGAAAICAAVLLGIRRKIDGKSVKMIVIMLLGYVTLVLSPANISRTAGEISEAVSVVERVRLLYDIAVGQNGVFWLFGLTFLLNIALLPKIRLPFALLLAAALAAKIIGAYTVCGIVLTVGMTVCGFVGLLWGKNYKYSIMLLAALLTVGMLLVSVTMGPRNLMPAVIIMLAVDSDILSGFFSKTAYKSKTLLSVISMVTAACMFASVLIGYYNNGKIINQNLTSIKNEEFYYNTELDRRYSYSQFFTDGYYRKAYRKVYGMPEDKKIFLIGSDFEDLYHNGVHCEYPVYLFGGKRYYPLRNIIEAEGGRITYDEKTEEICITLNEREFVLKNDVFDSDGIRFDAKAYRLTDRTYGYMAISSMYYSGEVYESVFNIKK